MATTDIAVASSLTAQTVWTPNGARISAIITSDAPGLAYLRFSDDGAAATTTLGGWHYRLVEGASADIDAPQSYQHLSIIFDTVTSGKGLTGEAVTSDSGIADDATTLGTLKTLIASDLERTLTDTSHASTSRTWDNEISVAILDAVKLYKSKHWWFLQEPTATAQTSTCSTTTSYVSEPTGLIQLDSLRVTANSQRYEVKPVSFSEMESLHDGATTDTGQPYMYTRYGARVRLYPSPDQAYTLTWSGLYDQASLTSDAISNDWMTHGRLVIKAMAKLILLRDYIKSYEDVPAAQEAVMVAERALDREHMRRTGTRRLAARF